MLYTNKDELDTLHALELKTHVALLNNPKNYMIILSTRYTSLKCLNIYGLPNQLQIKLGNHGKKFESPNQKLSLLLSIHC